MFSFDLWYILQLPSQSTYCCMLLYLSQYFEVQSSAGPYDQKLISWYFSKLYRFHSISHNFYGFLNLFVFFAWLGILPYFTDWVKNHSRSLVYSDLFFYCQEEQMVLKTMLSSHVFILVCLAPLKDKVYMEVGAQESHVGTESEWNSCSQKYFWPGNTYLGSSVLIIALKPSFPLDLTGPRLWLDGLFLSS